MSAFGKVSVFLPPFHSPPVAHRRLPPCAVCRQRASHTYHGRTGVVRYDLTRTWAGTSRTHAEACQTSQPPRCELELELLRATPDAAPSPDATPTYREAAASLLAKVHDVARLVVQEERT